MKEVTVFIEERFLKDEKGNYYSNVFNDYFWERYLSVFDTVKVIARAKYDCGSVLDKNRLSDRRIEVLEVPYYHGVLGFAVVFFRILLNIYMVSGKDSKFILRLPGVIGSISFAFLFFRRKSYGVELVGDPFHVFSKGGPGGWGRPLLKCFFYLITKLACRKATAVAYVTQGGMQKRYPCSDDAFSTYYSSIVLDKEFIVNDREIGPFQVEGSFSLLAVGTMEQRYKGFDILIRALPEFIKIHPNVSLTLVGDGFYRGELSQLAESLGVSSSVKFVGQVERDRVFDFMDKSDLFIIPSRTEGVPRVLIEAFARGLPSIGSDVGGIPELLDDDFIFKSESVEEVVSLLLKVAPDDVLRRRMSEINILRANDFESKVLSVRRDKFYRHVLSAK